MEWRSTDNRKTRRAALTTPEGQKAQSDEIDRRLGDFYRALAERHWGPQTQSTDHADVA